MKKAYIIISSIGCALLFIQIGIWASWGGEGGLDFMLRTVFIGELPLLFWVPAALISFAAGFKLPSKKEKLKNVLLACPAITLALIYTVGEYHGP